MRAPEGMQLNINEMIIILIHSVHSITTIVLLRPRLERIPLMTLLGLSVGQWDLMRMKHVGKRV